MNDRYLFRAKRIDNGEWVEGTYVHTRLGREMIADGTTYFGINRPCMIDIDVKTLCQCTGLKDKNGKLIWENDVCIIRDGTLDEEDGYFRLDWEIDRAMYEFEGTGLCVNFDNVYGYECEVAGNIFDNPELMEQEG